jgi:hypothetical protein
MHIAPRLGSLLLGAVLAACAGPGAHRQGATGADTAFAAMQTRGAEAMGVDQYTSSHVFEPLPDGGRIMRLIAERFGAGDFALPGFVHAQPVPGTAVMAARRDHISYTASAVPNGAELRITTTDSAALAAVHEFLAFQLREHHAAAHER